MLNNILIIMVLNEKCMIIKSNKQKHHIVKVYIDQQRTLI